MDKPTRLIVFVFCVLKLTLHLIADNNSGFQGDELLHIETGNNLAFGYMEFPPLIGVLAFIQNLFQSESVFVHHIFSHIAAILILIYVSKTIVELGGGAKAVLLVLLCLLPIMGRSQQLFQPVVFSQLFWVLAFYHLTRYVKYMDRKYLWYFTFTLILGFLTKYDIIFLVIGATSLFFFKSTRDTLVKHKFWWNIAAFIALVSPNIIWQYVNDFPVLKMFARLYETQLDKLVAQEILKGLVVSLNPITLLISIPGIICMFHPYMKRYRPLSFSIALSAFILAYSQGKAYYFYPIVLTILAFGGIFWENIVLVKRNWLIYPIAAILFISGVIFVPFSLPITSLESYLRNEYPYEKKEVQGGKFGIKEERYSKLKWDKTFRELQHVLDSLPDNEREMVLIWGKHYGQAGALKLFQDQYALPASFSLHGSFYSWLPTGDMPSTILAIRYSQSNGRDFFEPFFEEVTAVKSIYNPYGDEKEKLWQTIFICKGPTQSFDELKKLFANRIFE